MSTRFSGFVESICGQQNDGTSGWMFVVNGVDPGIGADKCQVKMVIGSYGITANLIMSRRPTGMILV